ncbi:RecQ family ATP-dependent DNA helicase [Bacteroidales bacterium OttesenSCG-928-M11]|nr:RecQ family ATP-dependent DNA helicase [Bacteroidales bacterium OttesenSCG-928-M11]
MNRFYEVLRKYWGYDSFRSLQEEIILSVYEGKDTLGLMPTGGGKSLTFQVPTMLMEGLCLVVTPLISLMKDQVDNLHQLGIKAACVHSGMGTQEIITTLENCIFGDYKFLYISPERLNSDLFLSRLAHMKVCLITVDESHCISQWGYDFRPAYLHVSSLRDYCPNVPILALTATATTSVIEDIQDKLKFRERNVLKKSFKRNNLAYVVREAFDKLPEIVRILDRVSGSAIIYVRSRSKTQEIAQDLQRIGISAEFYHAGISSDEKIKKQDRWKNDQCRVMVATNAFGMGIDKPDVRLVIHYEFPSSLEEYFQEAGRAGRDGLKSYAVALTTPTDRVVMKRRIKDSFPEKDFVKDVYEKLAYYYEIGINMGLHTSHMFDLGDFCRIYHYNMTHVYNALKILDLSGYIEYIEETERRSRLLFLVSRESLYSRFQKDIDDLINVLMRTYTGLFSEYRYIDENLLVQRSGLSQQKVYESLCFLSELKVIDYIPAKNKPLIRYSLPREELKYLNLPTSVYENRKERLVHRIENVLYYRDNQSQCRSNILTAYFGEKEIEPCGICDICLENKRKANPDNNCDAIADSILSLLKDKDWELASLLKQFDYTEKQVMDVLRYLLDSRKIKIDNTKLIFNKIK